ncbi:hypothetical protein GJAV_G00033400, partial [Gymnothorax javanicus]
KKKNGTLKPQEKKEKWESQTAKRRREVENGVTTDPPENGFCDRGANMEREPDRGKERVKKTSNSKRNKQVKGLLGRPVRTSEDETLQELGRPQRSNSKDHFSESSTHSLSGRGYSCFVTPCFGREPQYLKRKYFAPPIPAFLEDRKGPGTSDVSSRLTLRDPP